jgi:precorrin-3B C17-methyltransferase
MHKSTKAVVYTVGIGNSPAHLTAEAREILASVDVVAGHYGFIEMLRGVLRPDVKVIDDREARKRAASFVDYQQCRISAVVTEAMKGRSVAVVSGGDSGIWGMAGVFLEARTVFENAFDVKVIPGVPALVTIAARLGAPLQNGFTLISVGDEDTPFAVIEQRLRGAALGGGAIVLYKMILENLQYPEYYPRERYPELFPPAEKMAFRWRRTYEILAEHVAPDTPMAVVTDACDQTSNYSSATAMLGSEDGRERLVLAPFRDFLTLTDLFRFFTTVIIGDATTRRMGEALVTPQWHYKWKYSPEMRTGIEDLPYLKEAGAFFRKEQV